MSRRRGWFPDHWDPNVLRYWDGQRWTGRTVSMNDIETGAHVEITRQAQAEADEELAAESSRVTAGAATVFANADAALREVFGRRSAAVTGGPKHQDKPDVAAPTRDEPVFQELPHSAPIVTERLSHLALFSMVCGIIAIAGATQLWWVGVVPMVLAVGGALHSFTRINTIKGLTGRWAASIGLVTGLIALPFIGSGAFAHLTRTGQAHAEVSSASAQHPKILSELATFVAAQESHRGDLGAFAVETDSLTTYGYSQDPEVVIGVQAHPGRYCVQARADRGTAWWHMSSSAPTELIDGTCPEAPTTEPVTGP